MNHTAKYFIFAVSFCSVAHGASLLQPQSFSKTANDLTFIQNAALESAGYEPYAETIYDASGRCVVGCAYPGITIQEDLQQAAENTVNAYAGISAADWAAFVAQMAAAQSVPLPQAPTGPATVISENVAGSQPSAPVCTPRQNEIPRDQRRPLGEPLVGRPRVTSPYGTRTHPVTGQTQSFHRAVDFAASVGTTVFTPASGTVARVWTDTSCGNGLRITHADGYETVYCHLSQVLVAQGEPVQAGCAVAKTGNTGRTTGPHLHYGIKHNGNYIDPTGMLGRG